MPRSKSVAVLMQRPLPIGRGSEVRRHSQDIIHDIICNRPHMRCGESSFAWKKSDFVAPSYFVIYAFVMPEEVSGIPKSRHLFYL